MVLLLEENVMVQHLLLLTFLADLIVVDFGVALVDELLEHHGGHVESVSSPMVQRLLDD